MDPEPKAQILVAEDSSAVAHVIRAKLTSAGFSVTVARDGMEALQTARDTKFDLVLTDEQMPHLNGRELCLSLRADPRYQETPIIFVTGKEFEIESEVVTSGLATAMFGKPFSPGDLLETVEATLRNVDVATR